MKIEYDEKADAIYIQLRKSYVEENIDIEEGISIDIDKDRHVVGIEILNASKVLTLKEMLNIQVKNLPICLKRAMNK